MVWLGLLFPAYVVLLGYIYYRGLKYFLDKSGKAYREKQIEKMKETYPDYPDLW